MVKNKKRTAVIAVVVLILVLLICGTISGTFAFLSNHSSKVKNEFSVGSVPIEIEESFNGAVKTDVTVVNSGNVSAYIRVKLIPGWYDTSGNLVYTSNLDETYNIILSNDKRWNKASDGYYYYSEPVGASESTSILIKECKPISEKGPEGAAFRLDVLAQSIQAEGKAAKDAGWVN